MLDSNIKDITSIARVLKSKTCLYLLNYLAQMDFSNQDLFEKLKKKNNISYRSSIFEALKRIQEAGLIEKYYDNKVKKIKYKLNYTIITIDLNSMKISFKKKKD